MGEFIQVKVDFTKCIGIKECGKCVQVCPVGIFGKKEDTPEIIEPNEDECTLCGLCLDACKPVAVSIIKLYEQ